MIHYCLDYDEYRVTVEGATYYTSDLEDAKDTYKAMAGSDWPENKRIAKGNPNKW